MKDHIAETEKTRLRRLPKRGKLDRQTIYAILDVAIVRHVGFVADGQPNVIPTGFARIGDDLYVHGSAASRMLRTLSGGVEVCVTVTLLDGLVLARSAFHHSINYRSVIVLGRAALVVAASAKSRGLEAFTEHIVPGRWADVRWPTELELKATSVLKLPITEASAKVRTGPPIDDEDDYDLDVWAGVLPMSLQAGKPLADERLTESVEVPEYVKNYDRASASKER